MHREVHRWYSHRLGREMGVVVHGHWGPPLLMFPTTGGDEGEYERQSVIGTMAGAIEAGRVKTFCVNTNNGDSYGNAAPSAASQLDAASVRRLHPPRGDPVHPPPLSIRRHRGVDDGRVAGGVSRGEHPLQNTGRRETLLRLVGRLRHEAVHGRLYDDNFYFNNPVDYLANASDPWLLGTWRAARFTSPLDGPWEHREESYRLSRILAGRGIAHHLDDWGPLGGHDWPYWRHQMQEYSRSF
jgi:esterase/lipase superfamily enzyme